MLSEKGEMTATNILSYCGLNYKKHKEILDLLEEKGLIEKKIERRGKRKVTIYKVTKEGTSFAVKVLMPYEKIFPRRKSERRIMVIVLASLVYPFMYSIRAFLVRFLSCPAITITSCLSLQTLRVE